MLELLYFCLGALVVISALVLVSWGATELFIKSIKGIK